MNLSSLEIVNSISLGENNIKSFILSDKNEIVTLGSNFLEVWTKECNKIFKLITSSDPISNNTIHFFNDYSRLISTDNKGLFYVWSYDENFQKRVVLKYKSSSLLLIGSYDKEFKNSISLLTKDVIVLEYSSYILLISTSDYQVLKTFSSKAYATLMLDNFVIMTLDGDIIFYKLENKIISEVRRLKEDHIDDTITTMSRTGINRIMLAGRNEVFTVITIK